MKYFIAVFTVTAILGCAPQGSESNPRSSVPLYQEPEISQEELKSLEPMMDGDSNASACGYFETLKGAAPGPRFSLLQKISAKGDKLSGYINVAKSPFVQFALGDFKLRSDDEFKKYVKGECAANRLEKAKCLLMEGLFLIGQTARAQRMAVNATLETSFPGLFEKKATDLSQSLSLSLARRVTDISKVTTESMHNILAADLSLFPTDSTWAALAQDSKRALHSSVQALKSNDTNERLCALVLTQRHFAQLLTIKGFNHPEMSAVKGDPNFFAFEKLSEKAPVFKIQSSNGAFIDGASGRATSLSPDTIANYNPMQPVSLAKTIGSSEPANLTENLALMQSLLYSFEFTSPASPWVTGQTPYLLGDIQNEKSGAILPSDAHKLVLGLLILNFKNLAVNHLVQINAVGGSLQAGEKAAGALIVSEPLSAGTTVAHIKLSDITRTANLVA